MIADIGLATFTPPTFFSEVAEILRFMCEHSARVECDPWILVSLSVPIFIYATAVMYLGFWKYIQYGTTIFPILHHSLSPFGYPNHTQNLQKGISGDIKPCIFLQAWEMKYVGCCRRFTVYSSQDNSTQVNSTHFSKIKYCLVGQLWYRNFNLT